MLCIALVDLTKSQFVHPGLDSIARAVDEVDGPTSVLGGGVRYVLANTNIRRTWSIVLWSE